MPNFNFNKFGGGGLIVQVDETMMNYKCKSHRGRSPLNRTDSLCMVEIRGGKILRCLALVIPDKSSATISQIILNNVTYGSVIHTDEHGAYKCLSELGFIHGTVCHKYEFVNYLDGVNTQAVESFNGEMKRAIRARKGVYTTRRQHFLNEFCFFFNNRGNHLFAVLSLIKLF